MEHTPSTYTATITLDFQQIMEVRKAISDRVVKYALATDEQYPYRHSDMATLLQMGALLERHITKAVEEWESEVARTEATVLEDDEAIAKFLDGKS